MRSGPNVESQLDMIFSGREFCNFYLRWYIGLFRVASVVSLTTSNNDKVIRLLLKQTKYV